MWPGAMDMMNQLKGHVHLSATTNGIGSVQRRRIISAGLDIYFDEVVISDEIGFAKPAAAYFDHTFNRLLHPEKNDVIILGDNLGSDIRGGVNYGIDACWFNPNKGTKAYGNIHPTYEISELSDFVAVIK
jgi:HAD superfamily hydrolase (TIGR01549 family)